jgi:hypothetical protein
MLLLLLPSIIPASSPPLQVPDLGTCQDASAAAATYNSSLFSSTLGTVTCLYSNNFPDSDVNVHKTNSFLRLNFQFVSISKRNVLFYPYITVIEMKIKTNSFKNQKNKNKTKRNER